MMAYQCDVCGYVECPADDALECPECGCERLHVWDGPDDVETMMDRGLRFAVIRLAHLLRRSYDDVLADLQRQKSA